MTLSIIIPVFNKSETIERTIQSILNYAKKDIEIVVIDDGSTDDSIQITKKLFESSSLKYAIYHQTNSGVSTARNHGIKKAISDYVLFLDADDSLHPDFLSSFDRLQNLKHDLFVYQYVTKSTNSLVSNPFGLIKEEGLVDIFDELDQYFYLKRNRMSFQITSIIFRREFLIENEIFFDENLKSGEDSLFILNAMMQSKSVYNVPMTLFYYVQTEGSVTNSYNIRLLDSFHSMSILSELFSDRDMDKLSQLVDLKSSLLLQLQLFKLKRRAKHLSTRMFLREVSILYPNLGEDLSRKITNSRKAVKGLKLHLLWLEVFLFSLVFGYLFGRAK